MPSAISCDAPSPWTLAGHKMRWQTGKRRVATFMISLITLPVGEVTMPTFLGNRGIIFFLSCEKSPSDSSFFLSCSNATAKSPMPWGVSVSIYS